MSAYAKEVKSALNKSLSISSERGLIAVYKEQHQTRVMVDTLESGHTLRVFTIKFPSSGFKTCWSKTSVVLAAGNISFFNPDHQRSLAHAIDDLKSIVGNSYAEVFATKAQLKLFLEDTASWVEDNRDSCEANIRFAFATAGLRPDYKINMTPSPSNLG